MKISRILFLLLLIVLISIITQAADKPALTLDEFFNYVDFPAVQISPDGQSVVICAERADWDRSIYREDLWLYREGKNAGELVPLTQSGRDHTPRWSPDGRWIAFLSERKPGSSAIDAKESTTQLYLISPLGSEAIQVTLGTEDVHAFTWSADSKTLYFATREPWAKTQQDAYEKEWKDVVQYRRSERGDRIYGINVAGAITRHAPGAQALAATPWSVQQLVASPDGRQLAFVTTSVSGRWEKFEEFEIYAIDLAGASLNRQPRQLTHNEGFEENLSWAKDGKHIFFDIEYGTAEGKYKDMQTHLYWLDAGTGEVQRWSPNFDGMVTHYALLPGGSPLASGRLGTEVQLYTQASPATPFTQHPGWSGTYERLSTSPRSSRLAFVYSSLDKPQEVYLAESADKLEEAKPLTSFNKLFTERNLPQGKPYRWKADDGTIIEGMLMYPPGRFEAKNLPLFVFIHGGPDDADGNHFAADWYVWDRLAAGQGWLVFEPNYRGSTGYGDKFLAQMEPQILTRPGKDVLEGVDALVKDGIADPSHLTVGGYSYGGYLTNWLITQTDRFKAAVTGGGAVEHVVNWGNDDTSQWDTHMLGGLPWEVPQRYQEEAAIFQIQKVRTPTHMVIGGDDIRVAMAESYLLEHALHILGIPSNLLILPGEDHSLSKNPWHAKIKVREELKWLEKYGGSKPNN